MHTCHCGKEVRLGAQRITVERRSGVYHYIIHVDGTEACDGPWTCIAVKPYPKDENQKEYAKLIRRWNAHQSTAKETSSSRCVHPKDARSLTNRCLICDQQVIEQE